MNAEQISRRGLSSLHLVESPRAGRTLARALGVALVGIILALSFAPWQQNVAGTGRVVAFEPYDRIQTLSAPVSGRIRQAWVLEGSRVAQGDRILEIVDNDPSILERLETQRAALTSQLSAARQKVAVYQSQVDALQRARELSMEGASSLVEVATANIASARHGLDAARAEAEQAELNFRRQRDLVDEGLASTLDFEIAERVYKQALSSLEQAKQAWAAAKNDESARRSELGRVGTEATAGIDSARAASQSAMGEVAALEQSVASLESRIAKQNTQLITAPRSGTILRLYAAPGAELVKAGDPLVSLVPDTASRAVELWVDGMHIPLIEEDRPVRLQFEGWPAVQFAGWPSVAVGTFGGIVALVDQSANADGQFRLLVVPDEQDAPWPDPGYLRQGGRANGFVLLDQVSLGYELWRQANGFPPTVAMQGERDSSASGGPPKGKGAS